MYYNYPIFKEGERLTATDLNNMLNEIVRRTKLFAAPPLFIQDGAGGATLTFSDNKWFAVICGREGEDYIVYEVVPDVNGAWQILPEGRSGVAFEFNKFSGIPEGKIVQIKPGFKGEYIFECYAHEVVRPVSCVSSPSSEGSSFSSEVSSESSSAQSSISSGSSCPVNADTLAGYGLEAVVNALTLCKELEVKQGCNILVNEDGVNVDVDSLAGFGLQVFEEDCPYLEVKPGCHISTDANGVNVTPSTLAGLGLEVTSTSSVCAPMKVKPGCHIKVNNDGVGVELAAIYGEGLGLASPEEGCEYLYVKTTGCIVADVPNGVYFDTTVVDTYTQEIAGAGELFRDGDSITLITPVQTIEYGLNSCGVIVSVTDLGTQYRTSSAYVCCSSSSSNASSLSSGSSGSSGQSVNCAGWYCCPETQAVVYLETCEEVEDYPCGTSSASSGDGGSSASSGGGGCPGGSGSWVFECVGGTWFFLGGDGTCEAPVYPPDEPPFDICIDTSLASYDCETCSWNLF